VNLLPFPGPHGPGGPAQPPPPRSWPAAPQPQPAPASVERPPGIKRPPRTPGLHSTPADPPGPGSRSRCSARSRTLNRAHTPPRTAGRLQLGYRCRPGGPPSPPPSPPLTGPRSFTATPAGQLTAAAGYPPPTRSSIPVAGPRRDHPDRSSPTRTRRRKKPSGSITNQPHARRYGRYGGHQPGTRRPASGCRGFVSSTSAGRTVEAPRSVLPTSKGTLRLNRHHGPHPAQADRWARPGHGRVRPAAARPPRCRRPAGAAPWKNNARTSPRPLSPGRVRRGFPKHPGHAWAPPPMSLKHPAGPAPG